MTERGMAEGRRAAATFRADAAAIDKLLNGQDGPVAKMLARRAVQVERLAKILCPVDTGRLRSSIAWRFDRDARGLFAAIGTNVSYAAPVEFGTSRQRPQPFLRPAIYARGGDR